MREAIQVALAGVGAGFKAFMASGQVLRVLGVLFTIFLSLYIAREGVRFIVSEVQRRIGQPSLVRESSQSERGWICCRLCCAPKKRGACLAAVCAPAVPWRVRQAST